MFVVDTPPRLLTLVFLLAAWPGREGPREAFGQIRYVDVSGAPPPLPQPKLVGQPQAMEYVPAENLAYLRPPVASVDVNRPACELPAGSGKYTGVCTQRVDEAQTMMEFCGDLVRYRACVPAQQVMWPDWNATAKDTLLADLFKDMVEKRIAREMNVTPDLYVPIHYLSNPNCVNALRNALCWYNFPKCDDQNRSLPLCDTTCREYYSNCRYDQDSGGNFPQCSSSAYNTKGLFSSGVKPGNDQVLVKDRPTADIGTCEIVASDAAMGIVPEETSPPFYETWWGILLMVLGGLVLLTFLAYALIPPVLMEYLLKTAKRGVRLPLTCWRNFPTFAGRTLLIVLTTICVAALAVGIWRIASSGWDRWNEQSANTEAHQFKPPQYIWGMQATRALTNAQLKQLKWSCTCTGDASRSFLTLSALILVVVRTLEL